MDGEGMPKEVLPRDPFVGSLLEGRYQVHGVLAKGGVAVVYRGEDLELKRPIAVKVLRREWHAREELRSRLRREAKALASLSHPNIVHLQDLGFLGGACYLVMELVEGRTLADVLGAEPFGIDRAIGIIRQVFHALQHAHGKGVLHRDLKPGNVFLQSLPHTADHVKILDFGFAKFFDDGSSSPREEQPLTRSGIALGTPAYMAPEQAAGRLTDARADLYAAGVLLFEMLTWRRPFEGPAHVMMRDKVRYQAPALRAVCPQLGARPELEAWFQKSLAREPESRFSTAAEMLEALENLPQPLLLEGRASLVRSLLSRFEGVSAGRRRAWAWGAALGGGLLVCAAAGPGLWAVAHNSEVTAQLPVPESETDPSPDAGFDVDPPVSTVELGLPNPWTTGTIPEALAAAFAFVEARSPVPDDTIVRLRQYARENPDDPRPHVLMGHVFAQRGRRPLAVAAYERALSIDRNIRGDPRVLANLLACVVSMSSNGRIRQLVEDTYGTAAVPAVEAALRSPQLTTMEARRLEQLRLELTSRD